MRRAYHHRPAVHTGYRFDGCQQVFLLTAAAHGHKDLRGTSTRETMRDLRWYRNVDRFAEQRSRDPGAWPDILTLVVNGQIVDQLDVRVEHPEHVGLRIVPAAFPCCPGQDGLPEETGTHRQRRQPSGHPCAQPLGKPVHDAQPQVVRHVQEEVLFQPWAIYRARTVNHRGDAHQLRRNPGMGDESVDHEVWPILAQIVGDGVDHVPGAPLVSQELGSVMVGTHDGVDLLLRQGKTCGPGLVSGLSDLLHEALPGLRVEEGDLYFPTPLVGDPLDRPCDLNSSGGVTRVEGRHDDRHPHRFLHVLLLGFFSYQPC